MDDSEWTGPLAVGIVEVPDELPADLLRANLMLPCPSEKPNGIALEERDGKNVLRYEATSLRLTVGRQTGGNWKWEEHVRLDNGDISVYITDARVAFACTEYDKGGSFRVVGIPDVGDLLVLPILTLGSKVLAARRRRGKALVGQVRYQWLKEICFKPPDWRGKSNLLVDALSKDGQHYAISLTLRSAVGADKISAEIVRRYAAYLLSLEPAWDDEQLESLRQLTELEHLPSDHRVGVFKDGVRYSFHEMPVCFYMSLSTAAWKPPSQLRVSEDPNIETAGVSSGEDVLAVIELACRVETGDAEEDELVLRLGALAVASTADIGVIGSTIAWFADELMQKVPRERREAATANVVSRVRRIAEEVLPQQGSAPETSTTPQTIQALTRLIRAWFVSAPTIDERLEFLFRYWEDEPVAGEYPRIYAVALVVAAAAVAVAGGVVVSGQASARATRGANPR
jgi:hypothetical protein